MIYLDLFLSYLKIGLFSIGGGHASIPVAKSVVVDQKSWLNLEEFTAMITISEMTPGPFAVNSATYVGIKMAGIVGGLVATFSFALPSVLISTTFYFLIKKFRKIRAIDGLMQGIRPAVTGLIASAGVLIFISAILGGNTFSALAEQINIDYVAIAIAVVTFILSRKTRVNPVLLIFIAGALGALCYSTF